MFQFRAFPSYGYLIHRTIPEYCSGVLPHSEISGSTLICSSPKLIAACHVLLRLLMPRHSPCALSSLTCVEGTSFLRSGSLYKNYAGSTEDYTKLYLPNLEKLKFHIFCFKLRLFQVAPSVALLFIFFSVQFSRCNSGERRWWRIAGSNR